MQIGITLVGVLSGAFSGATLGARLSVWLVSVGLSQGAADALGVGAVVTLITYASLIVGELVPKQIALRDPEAVKEDVLDEIVSLERARSKYGVVLKGSLEDYDLEVDVAATQALRKQMAQAVAA